MAVFKSRPRPGAARFEDLATIPRHHGRMGPLVDASYRLALAAGFRSARLLWALTHPRHEGALVAIMIGPAMLMLRQSYRPELSMPGGGIAPGEDPAVAASRELAEELDLRVAPGTLRQVHVETGLWDGRHDTVTFFELDLAACPALRLDNREVVSATLVPFDEIDPAEVTPAVRAYVAWRRGRVCTAAAPGHAAPDLLLARTR